MTRDRSLRRSVTGDPAGFRELLLRWSRRVMHVPQFRLTSRT